MSCASPRPSARTPRRPSARRYPRSTCRPVLWANGGWTPEQAASFAEWDAFLSDVGAGALGEGVISCDGTPHDAASAEALPALQKGAAELAPVVKANVDAAEQRESQFLGHAVGKVPVVDCSNIGLILMLWGIKK